MALSPEEIKAISDIAKLLYSFLPGNPHPYADPSISFRGIAFELGLGKFWQKGSKLPAITNLLEKTLDFRRDMFCPLIVETVKRGIKYRANKGEEVTREEIERLNQLLLKVRFKIPELWDKNFLNSLSSTNVKEEERKEGIDKNRLERLKNELIKMEKIESHQRGYAFEGFLQELFDLFNLKPKSPFKLTGEQIDGSIELEGHTYLIEAKWQSKLTGQNDLLIFREKVESKATWSRGLFITYSGFTKEGLEAFSRGRPTNLIAMTGEDLWAILEGEMGLDDAIRLKSRCAAETGRVMVRVYELKTYYNEIER
ncbi:MAG TPA: hypothetical protein ENI49_05540 [Thermoplasmatales archaeon]|nr:hypothetical protein [Thermoplasmatales archaeon]